MVFDRVPRHSRSSGRVRDAGPALTDGCRRMTESPGQGCQAEKAITAWVCSGAPAPLNSREHGTWDWFGLARNLTPSPFIIGAMRGPIETLVIHPGALGDVLQAAPALSALER